MNIFSPDANKRINICESCKHFRKRTRTCGTPIVGNQIGSKRLCGCFMDVKTTLKFATCPLGKWNEQQLSHQEYLEIKKLLESTTQTITAEQQQQLIYYHAKYLGIQINASSCPPCVKNNLENLKVIIEQYEK